MPELINPSPQIHLASTASERTPLELTQQLDESITDPVDANEVFQFVRSIMDPEHPVTLEQLRVVEPSNIYVDNDKNSVKLMFTPTVPHCSMSTLIGLCIRVKLQMCLSTKFKCEVRVAPGTHNNEVEINKQLADKERVAAALEGKGLSDLVHKCLHELADD